MRTMPCFRCCPKQVYSFAGCSGYYGALNYRVFPSDHPFYTPRSDLVMADGPMVNASISFSTTQTKLRATVLVHAFEGQLRGWLSDSSISLPADSTLTVTYEIDKDDWPGARVYVFPKSSIVSAVHSGTPSFVTRGTTVDLSDASRMGELRVASSVPGYTMRFVQSGGANILPNGQILKRSYLITCSMASPIVSVPNGQLSAKGLSDGVQADVDGFGATAVGSIVQARTYIANTQWGDGATCTNYAFIRQIAPAFQDFTQDPNFSTIRMHFEGCAKMQPGHPGFAPFPVLSGPVVNQFGQWSIYPIVINSEVWRLFATGRTLSMNLAPDSQDFLGYGWGEGFAAPRGLSAALNPCTLTIEDVSSAWSYLF